MSEKEFTLDDIIDDIESQEMYSILEDEIDVSMLADDSAEETELDEVDEIDVEVKIDKAMHAADKKKLASLADLIIEDEKTKTKKKKVTVKKSKTPKIPGDACKQVFAYGQWQIELLGEAITSFHKYQDGWKKFGKLKTFEKLGQDLLYVCDEDGKLDYIYKKSDDSIVYSSSEAVLIRAKRITMSKAKPAKKAKEKVAKTKTKKAVAKTPVKAKVKKAKVTATKKKDVVKKSEFTQIVHVKFRTETGHWVLYGEEKENPTNLVELRKFNKLAYVLAAWRGRSAKILEAKQDTCHVYTEDGSAVDYTLLRGIQEYKPKEVKTKAEKAVAKSVAAPTQKPIPVVVTGTKALKGERKEGYIVERNKRLITVKFYSFMNKDMDYVQQFDAKSGNLMSSNPYHGWKLDFESFSA